MKSRYQRAPKMVKLSPKFFEPPASSMKCFCCQHRLKRKGLRQKRKFPNWQTDIEQRRLKNYSFTLAATVLFLATIFCYYKEIITTEKKSKRLFKTASLIA